MTRTTTILVGIALLTAACTDSSEPSGGDTLLTTPPTRAPTTTTLVTTTTAATRAATTTTTVPAAATAATTTTTTVAPATTTTTTDVEGAGDGNTADTLVQLPFTGSEPEVTLVALAALLLGFWLVQRSGNWQLRLARRRARWWRRPGAQSADPGLRPPWPPNALAPATDADRRFRHLARTLADRYGVSFLDGVDAYATRWAQTLDLAGAADEGTGDPIARWQAALAAALTEIYGDG